MLEAVKAVRAVADQLLELTRRFRDTHGGGGFMSAIVALSHVAVVAHVVARRERELREAQTAGVATAADSGDSADNGSLRVGPVEQGAEG